MLASKQVLKLPKIFRLTRLFRVAREEACSFIVLATGQSSLHCKTMEACNFKINCIFAVNFALVASRGVYSSVGLVIISGGLVVLSGGLVMSSGLLVVFSGRPFCLERLP